MAIPFQTRQETSKENGIGQGRNWFCTFLLFSIDDSSRLSWTFKFTAEMVDARRALKRCFILSVSKECQDWIINPVGQTRAAIQGAGPSFLRLRLLSGSSITSQTGFSAPSPSEPEISVSRKVILFIYFSNHEIWNPTAVLVRIERHSLLTRETSS